ncbi:MAG: DUF262 domain-containing protein [Muribaculaceae bacterium]|nr:DUF262 domain-containing protein [Muribaculaceae bacterium]
MSISKLHTLEKLLSDGVDISVNDNEDRNYPIAGILIPRIQRPYAQGRRNKNISDIRRNFVENLLSAVSSEEACTLELSFIFGSLQKVNWDNSRRINEALELLDGQQRLTTLFLLHWYLYKKESSKDLPEWLSRFRYETRDSSTTFLLKITDNSIEIDLNEIVKGNDTKSEDIIKPSEAITRLIWFNNDFRCDTTVMSMLCMLDEIDSQYKDLDKKGKTQGRMLHKNLGRIQFYIRLLLKFDMSDLLFIKMNSRGLPLVPFENFKADVMKYMEKAKTYDELVYVINDNPSPFHFYFASQVDTKWVYIFWDRPAIPIKGSIIELDDKRTGARFFRFFNRMLFTKLAVDYAETEDSTEMEELESACEFFRTIPEISMNEHLTDWNTKYLPAISRWNGGEDYFRQSAKVLNVLSDNYTMGIKLRDAIRKSPFISTSKFDIFSKANDANGTFTYAHRAFLSVIIDFIIQIPEEYTITSSIVANNLRKLIRVLHNVIEYTEIDKQNILDFIKAFHKILLSIEVQSGDFYCAIAKYDGNFEWIKAEAAKAKDICRDGRFEAVMVRAEEHPILRGRITPIYKQGEMTVEQLSEYVDELFRIFPVDKKGICLGISNDYALEDSHLLIRAMMSCLTSWDKLVGTYVTERGFVIRGGEPVNSQYLSNILLGKGRAESLFQRYFFEYFGKKDFGKYLVEVIENAGTHEIDDERTRDVYNRLVTESDSCKLYNWIKSREKDRPDKEPVVRWLRDAGILNYDGTNYDRLVLTTPRRYVIPAIIHITGAHFEDKSQEGHVQRFGEYFAYDVSVVKDIKTNMGLDITIKATFYPNGLCKVYVKSTSQEVHNALKTDHNKDESSYWHSYKDESSAQVIGQKINDWAALLQTGC